MVFKRVILSTIAAGEMRAAAVRARGARRPPA
jgi:hypothetical protein